VVTHLVCGVPQGSWFVGTHVTYADDTQAYGSCQPNAVDNCTFRLSGCCEAATSWMRSNSLQPNPDKTEVLWCTTSRRQHQLPARPLVTDGCSVYPAASVRDLVVYVDCDLSMMRAHVARTTSRCFASLSQLRQIRHSVPTATFQMLNLLNLSSSKPWKIVGLVERPSWHSVVNTDAKNKRT